jgi:tetratricopeptide (TPR) repeat protein
MAYPGNPELSAQAQERVMTAFRQVVSKLQDGQREQALIGLEFVLRLDPTFRPALNLQRQLASGASEIDLSGIITELQAPSTEAINLILVEAVEDFNQRNFQRAKDRVDQVLLELPGHQDARRLQGQINDALKVESQVGQFLSQAREALAAGDPQEAANFVMMAQALDPHHPEIGGTLSSIQDAGHSFPAPPAATVAQPPQPPSPAAPDPGDASSPFSFDTLDGSDGFGVQFDDFDDAAESPAPSPQSSSFDLGGASEEAAYGKGGGFFDDGGPSGGGGDDLFTSPDAGDVADLFEAPTSSAYEDLERMPSSGSGDEDDETKALLRAGDDAFELQSFAVAIHQWSRILLDDPDHAAARERIHGAKVNLAEVRRKTEPLLAEAHAAADAGDAKRAARLAMEILALEPTNAAAAELRERPVAADGQPPPPPKAATDTAQPSAPALPDLEDELFREDFDLDRDLVGDSSTKDDHLFETADSLPDHRGGRRLPPVRMLAIAAAGILVLLLGVWFGLRLLGSSEGDDEVDVAAVNAVLSQAQELYDQRRVEDAIHLLRSFGSAGLQQERIDSKIAKFEQALAPPTPTPIPPSLGKANELLDGGTPYLAYAEVMAGLNQHPQDDGLADLRQRVLAEDQRFASLYNAVIDNKFTAAAGISGDIVNDHPSWLDVSAVLEKSLFNAALAEMRAYNLTAADSYLQRLEKIHPGDPEVARVRDFVDRYKARPVDMQLQIFIRSLKER